MNPTAPVSSLASNLVARVAVVVAVNAAILFVLIPAPAPPPPAPLLPQVLPAPSSGGGTGLASWREIESTPGCWFFSGPGALGRDHHLGHRAVVDNDDGHLVVSFGDAAFPGDVDASGHVTLARDDDGKDGTESWRTHEEIDGTVVGDTFVGRYDYAECKFDVDGACIKNGSDCHISSALTINVAR